MRILSLFFTLLIAFLFLNCAEMQKDDPIIDIVFATKSQAQAMLSKEDDYTDRWSSFDIDSRVGKPGSTKNELLKFAGDQAQDWTTDERETISLVYQNVQSKIEKLGLDFAFPKGIYFIKSSLKEEGGAGGYTRKNYVVLRGDLISGPKEQLEHVVTHELFHIASRHDREFRKKMYAIIGFKLIDEIPFPKSNEILGITNPDAPFLNHSVELIVDEESKNMMMILFSKKEYSTGSFFEYLNIGFLQLDSLNNASYQDGEPIIYSMEEVSGFHEKIGKNTNYILHPEEIMAENFTHAILGKKDLPNPEIVQSIIHSLKRNK